MKIKRLGMIVSTIVLSACVYGCTAPVSPVGKPETATERRPDKTAQPAPSTAPTAKPTPTAAPEPEPTPLPPVKGIYVTGPVAATPDIFDERTALCDTTEINAMVIDVKESEGVVYFEGIPAADGAGASRPDIKDMKTLLKTLREKNIYTIGRIVTFKDEAVLAAHPEFALKLSDGSVFRESGGAAWLNPYNKDVWDYVAAIARGAAETGFQEIQFDYFRFPTAKKVADADFGETGGLSKEEIILACADYLVAALAEYEVKVSVDVYGTVILSDIDAGIVGQNYTELCKRFDFVSPMIYPSHFAPNTMDIDFPDLHPYDTIYKTLLKSNERLAGAADIKAVIRPWLQDFTASYLGENYQEYQKDQIREQISACYDAGISEWLLWSSGGSNTVDAFLPEE
ncbi:MAG: putative glycoside hydrolase [Clostridiales bacterium]|jgi:hypothetical protein|nr:putative glycoside hydrolase [Clostridiales bacterium]